MDRATFWALIAASRRGVEADDRDAQIEKLEAGLSKLTPEDLVGFQRIFDEWLETSYRADLWGAAYLINGGCSDDGFEYFRRWLISRGEKVYHAALAEPDSLARVVHEDGEEDFEEIGYLSGKVYESKTGKDYSEFLDQVHEGREGVGLTLIGDLADWHGPDGDIDEAKAKRLYPKLYRKFWD